MRRGLWEMTLFVKVVDSHPHDFFDTYKGLSLVSQTSGANTGFKSVIGVLAFPSDLHWLEGKRQTNQERREPLGGWVSGLDTALPSPIRTCIALLISSGESLQLSARMRLNLSACFQNWSFLWMTQQSGASCLFAQMQRRHVSDQEATAPLLNPGTACRASALRNLLQACLNISASAGLPRASCFWKLRKVACAHRVHDFDYNS